ncbi:hypothetical protein EB73_11785 [Mycobacterium sp. SWH-M3]|nr:hypothetical protein EB73_11785 [Mycobacterium sp. SWH-M3]
MSLGVAERARAAGEMRRVGRQTRTFAVRGELALEVPRYIPLARRPSSRTTSRCASRLAMSCRLSWACLPRARASSTLTLPSEKYIDSGTRVRLPSRILPIRLSICRRCSSSLRLRRGAWLVQVPW